MPIKSKNSPQKSDSSSKMFDANKIFETILWKHSEKVKGIDNTQFK